MPSKIAERVNSFSKNVTSVLPSMSGGILTNKWMLYLVLFSAIFDIFYFYKKNDMQAILIFLVIGFLVSFFSKNMVVILILAIVLTHLIRFGKQATEGFKDDEEEDEGFEEEDKDDEGFEEEDEVPEGFENEEDDDKEGFEDEDELPEGFEEEEEEMFENKGVGELIQSNNNLVSEMKKIEPLLNKAEGYLVKGKGKHEGFGDFGSVYESATKKPESFIDKYEQFAAHTPMPMHMDRFVNGMPMKTRSAPR